jgi:hypothetical protein
MPLPMKVESGDPTRVRVSYQGKDYEITVSLHVVSVDPGQGTDPHGLPQFNVQMAPIVVPRLISGNVQ